MFYFISAVTGEWISLSNFSLTLGASLDGCPYFIAMDRVGTAYVEQMVTVYRQYLMSDSWKRRNDLKKQLTWMEKELRQYRKFKENSDGVRIKNEGC